MNKTITIIMAAMLVLTACGIKGNVADEPITLGSILILTGEGSSWGQSARNGIDLAVEDLNSNGGVLGRTIAVDHQDDKSSTKGSLQAYQYLTDVKNVDIIIGTTWSFTGLPLVPLAQEDEVLIVSPSLGVAEFNEASEYLFNTWPHDYILSSTLADYVFAEGHDKVAVFGAEEVWVKDQTRAFVERFTELGGTSIVFEPQGTDTDLSTESLQIKNSDVDAVILTSGAINLGPRAAKKMREMGVNVPFYSMSLDSNIIGASSGAYDGTVFLTFLTPDLLWESRYVSTYGKALEIGGDSAYDAVMMIASAMEATGSTDTAVLQEYLNSISVYEGVSGTLVSDGKGGFTKDYVVMEVVNSIAVEAVR
jgi:branched-chain amino acid transport system substrate-binding protein